MERENSRSYETHSHRAWCEVYEGLGEVLRLMGAGDAGEAARVTLALYGMIYLSLPSDARGLVEPPSVVLEEVGDNTQNESEDADDESTRERRAESPENGESGAGRGEISSE